MIKSRGMFYLLLIILFALQACGSPDKTGNISGRLVYGGLEEKDPHEAMQNVRIVLCHVDRGLPKGPVVGDVNENNSERIGVIRANPTAETDSDGHFALNGVPVGSYLILIDLLPMAPRPQGDNWDGIILTKADIDGAFKEVPPSGKPDFWMEGGLVSGKGGWNSEDGFVLTSGMVGSKRLGFFFSVRDQKPYPIVSVRADSTVEIVLTSHIKPGTVKW